MNSGVAQSTIFAMHGRQPPGRESDGRRLCKQWWRVQAGGAGVNFRTNAVRKNERSCRNFDTTAFHRYSGMAAENDQLTTLQDALARFREGSTSASSLSELARAQHALLAALPPRYAEVLHGLLDRLESSALFSEESCSFSQKDLVDNLQMWVDKARQAL